MKKITLVWLFFVVILIFGCTKEVDLQPIISWDACSSQNGETMTFDIAKEIALNSNCSKEGILDINKYKCNSYTGTWWMDLEVEDKPLCNPACVVDIETKQVEINWRCTGAIVD